MASRLLKQSDERAKKTTNLPLVLKNLYEAEKDYVSQLDLLCNDFYPQLVELKLRISLNLIFPNVLHDLLVLHTTILKELGEATQSEKLSRHHLSIVLENFLDCFGLYRRYNLLYKDCMSELLKRCDKNKKVQHMLLKFKASHEDDWTKLYESSIFVYQKFGNLCTVILQNLDKYHLTEFKKRKEEIRTVIKETEAAKQSLMKSKGSRATLQMALDLHTIAKTFSMEKGGEEMVLYSTDVIDKDGKKVRMHITDKHIVFQGESHAKIIPLNPNMLEYDIAHSSSLIREKLRKRSMSFMAEDLVFVIWSGVKVLMTSPKALKEVVQAVEEISQPAVNTMKLHDETAMSSRRPTGASAITDEDDSDMSSRRATART